MLDSWVRYEGQVKTRQQRELAESIIAKIEKELEDPKVLKRILDQSVQDVESKSFIRELRMHIADIQHETDTAHRNPFPGEIESCGCVYILNE